MKATLIASAVSAVIAFGAGWKVCSWKYDADMLKLLEKIENQKTEITKQLDIVETLNAEKLRLQEQKQRVITREVIRYKPSGTMSPEWVRLHDCAATQTANDSSCFSDGNSGTTRTNSD